MFCLFRQKTADGMRFIEWSADVCSTNLEAKARGDFDAPPGAGNPIKDLGEHHDPDWWLKKLVEREKISVLPPALALRKEDLELDAQLDKENVEVRVVKTLEDFNRRIINARRQLEGGTPVITPLRDIDAEDRKSVVEGKSVPVRVDLVGRRNIKKKKRNQ